MQTCMTAHDLISTFSLYVITSYLFSLHEMLLLSGGSSKRCQRQNIGLIKELYWTPCVPKYGIFNGTGDVLTHVLHQPTCCGGICPNFCAEGLCTCRIPFYIYDALKDEEGSQVSSITKVWSGMGKELFTDASTFEVTFPSAADGTTKASIMGACFLLNQIYFESDNKNQY